ncbi:hypothetical protein BH09CHL1_BH09CHL1_16680 [soil metagenome]
MKNGSAIQNAVLDSLNFRLIGPHRGGRVVAVAGDPVQKQTFYFGACAGGVWKTVDGGITWKPISDGFFGTAAIGALAVSTADPNIIYAGTGETSIRGNVSHGDGIYKSTDAGRTWRNMGLKDTRHIGKIQIHPTNPEIVYVAALGHAFGPSEERGVFRTTNGGETWEKVLYRSDRAGSHDISMDLTNPRILYAVIWQAQRYPHTLVSGGEECGLFRTTDGGDTWDQITRKPGLPSGTLGKMGIVSSPAKAGRVWAVIEAEDGAVFRSDDWGEHWIRLSEEPLLRTRPWYYMHITVDPVDENTVYVQDYSTWRSIDAGATFVQAPRPHGDEHALWIDPVDNQRMINGNDGGASISFNGGGTWSTIHNQPTAQLYHVIADDQFPYRVYGSQQDNSAITVPSRTLDGAIHERTWFAPGGGESGYISIKPDEPWHTVASGPIGRRAYNDIMTHFDQRTGQVRNISVWPELYGWGAGADALKYRLQWTFPIHFSKHAPHPLYVAGNQLLRSDDLGSSFVEVSPDLTRNDPSKLTASGGPITRDNTGAEVYCTIFAFAESPRIQGVLWAGTDDGLVHRSDDAGVTWTNITPPDLPEWALISIIELSPHEEGVAYVAATRYKLDDTTPYLYKTTDNGASWTLITNDIPAYDFTRVIREDPTQRGLLYAGTETGIYVSFDDGANWQRLGGNLPVVPIHDFIIKGDELVVATHGRSFWILDDLSPIRAVAAGGSTEPVVLFAPRDTYRLRTYGGFGGDIKGVTNYGHAGTSGTWYEVTPDGEKILLTAGANPPDGVVVSYYLSSPAKDGLSITILDEAGAVIRSFSGAVVPNAAGINTFIWNMRYPGVEGPKAPDLGVWDRPDSALATPGRYQVTLSANGTEQTQSFELLLDPRVQTSAADLTAQRDYLLDVTAALGRTNALIDTIDTLRAQLGPWKTRLAEPNNVAAIETELNALRGLLIDVNIRGSQLWPSGLHEKFNALLDSADGADYAPPKQAVDVFAELSAQLDGLSNRLDSLSTGAIAELNSAIEEAGLPTVGISS